MDMFSYIILKRIIKRGLSPFFFFSMVCPHFSISFQQQVAQGIDRAVPAGRQPGRRYGLGDQRRTGEGHTRTQQRTRPDRHVIATAVDTGPVWHNRIRPCRRQFRQADRRRRAMQAATQIHEFHRRIETMAVTLFVGSMKSRSRCRNPLPCECQRAGLSPVTQIQTEVSMDLGVRHPFRLEFTTPCLRQHHQLLLQIIVRETCERARQGA